MWGQDTGRKWGRWRSQVSLYLAPWQPRGCALAGNGLAHNDLTIALSQPARGAHLKRIGPRGPPITPFAASDVMIAGSTRLVKGAVDLYGQQARSLQSPVPFRR